MWVAPDEIGGMKTTNVFRIRQLAEFNVNETKKFSSHPRLGGANLKDIIL
jgi:hypothetical protein